MAHAPLVCYRFILQLKVAANTQLAGPVLVSAALMPDASKFQIRGLKSGRVMQDCPLT
jgi:hypothetical protein